MSMPLIQQLFLRIYPKEINMNIFTKIYVGSTLLTVVKTGVK